MSKTPIEWTERTWNPVRGCSPVSPGCAHCYAEKTAGRFCGPGKPFDGFVQIGKNGQPGPHWTGKVELIEHMLDVPLRTRKPTTWFVNSMSDLFHENLADEVIDRVFAVMALCPHHTFQVLTKRSKRLREYFQSFRAPRAAARAFNTCDWAAGIVGTQRAVGVEMERIPYGLPNVWLGVSAEDQERADERIPDLMATPAEVRFLSCEPLLGPIDLGFPSGAGGPAAFPDGFERWSEERRSEWFTMQARATYISRSGTVDWVIVGGESGPGARPFDIRWARSIVRQCQDAGVPVFVKQLGARPRGQEQSVPEWVANLNKKGGNWEVWPEDLRVRQMPAVAR